MFNEIGDKARMKITLPLLALSVIAMPVAPAFAQQSVAQIKRKIVEQSIASYPGNCPCPDNTMRNGRRCGARSAYNRPGGYSPKCYPSDVSAADVALYRANHR